MASRILIYIVLEFANHRRQSAVLLFHFPVVMSLGKAKFLGLKGYIFIVFPQKLI